MGLWKGWQNISSLIMLWFCRACELCLIKENPGNHSPPLVLSLSPCAWHRGLKFTQIMLMQCVHQIFPNMEHQDERCSILTPIYLPYWEDRGNNFRNNVFYTLSHPVRVKYTLTYPTIALCNAKITLSSVSPLSDSFERFLHKMSLRSQTDRHSPVLQQLDRILHSPTSPSSRWSWSTSTCRAGPSSRGCCWRRPASSTRTSASRRQSGRSSSPVSYRWLRDVQYSWHLGLWAARATVSIFANGQMWTDIPI